MSRLLVDDVTKTDARALLNVNKMATISDIVAPSNEYIYASGANELTVVEGCVIAVGGAGIFKTANTILTAANLDAGSAFAVQPLNNNVVMGYDRKKGEVIIIGTGIGFRAKKGDQVDESKIQKMFITGENKQLLEMIGAIPPEYFELVEEIFEKAKEEYGFLPKEKETLALLDHIHFAIKRMKENLVLDNPFETEIRQFYPKEWEIGLYAKKCIKRRFGIEIPDAEVGYIAMHIIASEFQKSRRTVSKTFEVIDLALKYIRDNYLTDVKEDSLAYTRLVTHVKYFAQRYVDNKESMDEDELLDQTIKERFQREVCCIEGLSEMLYRKYGRPVTVSEENYLVLHLRNCVANKE